MDMRNWSEEKQKSFDYYLKRYYAQAEIAAKDMQRHYDFIIRHNNEVRGSSKKDSYQNQKMMLILSDITSIASATELDISL